MIKKIVKKLAFKYPEKFKSLYIKVCSPTNNEYALFLKGINYLYKIGDNCSINNDVNITDPKYVKIGNNVSLSSCTLIGHDGSIEVLNRAYNVSLESVGKIVISDNVFVGHGAIIMPGVTIGENVVIAAGAVVTKDVESGNIIAGVPARKIGETESLKNKLLKSTDEIPWGNLIKQREGAFDANLEPILIKERLKYFFPEDFIQD